MTRACVARGFVCLLFAAIALLGSTAPNRAMGAELFYMDHDTLTHEYVGAAGPLVISGDIEAGDYERLLQKISADEHRYIAQNAIILASESGDAGEALRIADFLKSLYARVTVGPLTGTCRGVCFLIYAAAAQRETDGERLVGIDRLTFADARARAFLTDNDVPGYLVQDLFAAGSSRTYWLSAQDEKALGVRSPAFVRYLKTRCGWDDALERDVYAARRPLADLVPLAACRDRVTRAAARKALAAARRASPAMR